MKPKYLLLAVLSGVLLFLSFPFLNVGNRCLAFPFLVWLALFPLLFSIKRVSVKQALYQKGTRQAFFIGLLAGFIFFLGLTYWLVYLMPWAGWLIVLGWMLLSLLEGATIAVFAWLAGLAYKKFSGVTLLFAIPCFWVALELLRSVGAWNFSWGILGLALHQNGTGQTNFFNLLVAQLASLFGSFSLSFLIVLINVFLVEVADFFLKKEGSKGILNKVAVTLVVFLLVVGWGVFSLAKRKPQVANAKVSLVQANIAQNEKWLSTKSDDIRKSYLNLTKKAVKSKPYLVIWPESALPGCFSDEEDFVNQTKRLVFKHDSHLLLGSLSDKDNEQFNSAFLLSLAGKQQKYDKLKLVLFGEYIPNWPVFNQIKETLDLGESLSAGKRLVVFSTTRGELAAVICFESADSSLCRQLVLKGAQARLSSPAGDDNGGQVLAVLTNDAWFGKSPLAYQHLSQAAARAVENNVYTIQTANTGLSAVIDSKGRIIEQTSLFERKVLTNRIAFQANPAFYTRFGYLFSYFCLLATIVAAIYLGYKAKN